MALWLWAELLSGRVTVMGRSSRGPLLVVHGISPCREVEVKVDYLCE